MKEFKYFTNKYLYKIINIVNCFLIILFLVLWINSLYKWINNDLNQEPYSVIYYAFFTLLFSVTTFLNSKFKIIKNLIDRQSSKQYKKQIEKIIKTVLTSFVDVYLDQHLIKNNYINLNISKSGQKDSDSTNESISSFLDKNLYYGHTIILGNAGFGKTLLTNLISKELLTNKKQLPLIISLSNFKNKNELESFIIDNIAFKYQIPENLVIRLLNNEDCILIFDSLDEIESRLTRKQFLKELKILSLDKFASQTILVTSKKSEFYDSRIEGLNFDIYQIEQSSGDNLYAFLSNVLEDSIVHQIMNDCKNDTNYNSFMKTPFFCLLVCKMILINGKYTKLYNYDHAIKAYITTLKEFSDLSRLDEMYLRNLALKSKAGSGEMIFLSNIQYDTFDLKTIIDNYYRKVWFFCTCITFVLWIMAYNIIGYVNYWVYVFICIGSFSYYAVLFSYDRFLKITPVDGIMFSLRGSGNLILLMAVFSMLGSGGIYYKGLQIIDINRLLAGFFLGGLLGFLLFGVKKFNLSDHIYPLQGIHRSIKYGVLGSLISLVVIYFATDQFKSSIKQVEFTTKSQVEVMVIIFLISAGTFGLFQVLKHFILRNVLDKLCVLPFRINTFFAKMEKLRLLTRNGSGYSFSHKYISDYFKSI